MSPLLRRTPLRSRAPRGRYATAYQKKRALKKAGHLCVYCDRPIEFMDFQADHEVPHSKGGATEDDNLVAACHRCNAQKGTMSAEEFRALVRGTA